jgi:hypothetical protein
VNHYRRALVLDRHARVADEQRDSIRLQVRSQRRAGIGLLEAEKARTGFDDSDLRAEAGESLAELDADRSTAEHRQRGGQLARHGGLAVRPVVHLVQPRDGRDGGGTSVGDHDGLARDQLLAPHLHRPQVHQLPLAAHELCAGRLESGSGTCVVEVAGHPEHPFRNLRKVDVPFHTRGGQGAGATRFLERLAGAQQRLRRDASPVGTLAAHKLALDDNQRKAAPFKPSRDGLARDTAAQADDVKLLWQPAHLLHRSRAEAIPTMRSP